MYIDLMDGSKMLALILLVLCAWLLYNYMNKNQTDREEQLIKLLETMRNCLQNGASGCSNAIEKLSGSYSDAIEKLGDQISDLSKAMASHKSKEKELFRVERNRKDEERKRIEEERTQTDKERSKCSHRQTQVLEEISSTLGRPQIIERLPTYDGLNRDFDDWWETVLACMNCNEWEFAKVMTILPLILTGRAKRAFDSIATEEILTTEEFFESMQKRLDPQSNERNRNLFMCAERGASENAIDFVYRCLMYLRRSGKNSKSSMLTDILIEKICKSMSPWDKKLLVTSISNHNSIEEIAFKADDILVMNNHLSHFSNPNQEINHPNKKIKKSLQECWVCKGLGHRKRDCPLFLNRQIDQSGDLRQASAQNKTTFTVPFTSDEMYNIIDSYEQKTK